MLLLLAGVLTPRRTDTDNGWRSIRARRSLSLSVHGTALEPTTGLKARMLLTPLVVVVWAAWIRRAFPFVKGTSS